MDLPERGEDHFRLDAVQQGQGQVSGQAYDFIAFDELTHFTWEEYSYLFSRNRPNGPGTRVYIALARRTPAAWATAG